MLIDFSVENWMSFRDKACFSMVGSRERQHNERVPRLKKYKTKILPVASIYGGNASGKTNFFRALNFVRDIIVDGSLPDRDIFVEPFILDKNYRNKPSKFEITMFIDEENMIYKYCFSVVRKGVVEESLTKIYPQKSEVLYDRKKSDLYLAPQLGDENFKKFLFKSTRPNQLFLTSTVFQNLNDFKPIYNWFRNSLELISPVSKFRPFEFLIENNNPLNDVVNNILPKLDTGIASMGSVDVRIEDSPVLAYETSRLEEGTSARISAPGNERFLIAKQDGELKAKKLVTFHEDSDGNPIKFNINQESDGTQRIIDLAPAFLEILFQDQKKTYIIDEVDRSLHTVLTRRLIETYLEKCNENSRSQLLMTTHDALLIDQNVFRRDEMWVAERDITGNSELIAFSEYKDVRYDKDIRKSYLQGKLGGIPRLLDI